MTDVSPADAYACGVTTLLDWCDAHWTTHSATACARIVLSTYNAEEWPLSFRNFWLLDEDLRPAALDVIVGHLTTGREAHAFGEEARIQALWRRMRPEDFEGHEDREAAE